MAPLERVGPTRQIIGTTCPGAGVTGLFDARLINCMGGQKRQEMAQEPRHDFQVKQLSLLIPFPQVVPHHLSSFSIPTRPHPLVKHFA